MNELHSASASMTGYLFQARIALLLGLKEVKHYPSHTLSIEHFDDVSFEEDGIPIELIQTKHHVNGGSLLDGSVDVWRTLHIWIKQVLDDPTSSANTRFVFITTNEAPNGSAMSMLRHVRDLRNESEAMELLCSVASESQNQATSSARGSFQSLTDAERHVLVRNIWVFDKGPNITDVRDEIEDEIHYSASPDRIGKFTDNLEGWWFNRVVLALSDSESARIPLADIQNKVSELREEFKIGILRLNDEIESMPPPSELPEDNRTFVRQMNLVGISSEEMKATVHDYYRAFEQRSRWARENILLDGETNRYDMALHDAWQRRFLACTTDISESSNENLQRNQGKKVFRWAREYQKPLRNRDEIWLSSGSFQMLSDEVRIGWHPNFETILQSDMDK